MGILPYLYQAAQAMVKVRIATWSDAHLEKSILAAELAGADAVEAADDTEALDSDWLVEAVVLVARLEIVNGVLVADVEVPTVLVGITRGIELA
jgi:hypothetical protein